MFRTVALTGATGFIGRVLIAKLAASGWKVRALARRVPFRQDLPLVEWICGDMNCDSVLCDLVSGTEAVIHCAGAIRGKSWDDFSRTNVTGTRNILRAASGAPSCSRFLFISSLAAREPHLSWYARSKFEAEQLIPGFSGLASTVFRPAAVYGLGDKAMQPFFQAMRYGILPVPGDPGNRFGLIHVDDMVAAIHNWLEAGQPVKGTYEIDDGTSGGYDYTSIAALAEQVLSRPVHCLQIPLGGIRMLARFNLWLAHLLNYAPILTPGKVMEFQHPDWTCDISSLKRELAGWSPVTKLETVLPLLVRM
ncbi:NAD(P)-dependent oxidoreductase [Nitrosomonas europaea]|uniref:NAD-dependent epimerase/dehydratase family protein n=1 Tax=Nitrosomonas europaea TaxID=915 RepID=UPI0032675938|nr:NAD(P)-dependent oxidoreductase [Nitrosomonas sp. PRO5]